MKEQHPNDDYVLKIGDWAKPFALADTDGSVVSLEDVLQRGPAVIVFYRGDW